MNQKFGDLFAKFLFVFFIWTCDNCGDTAEISCADTHIVSIYCNCDNRCHPECNTRWYNENWCYEKDKHKKYFEGIMK